jgi:hypothetical protein
MGEVAEDGGGCGDDAGCGRGHSAAGSGSSESGGDPGGGTRQVGQGARVGRSLHLPAFFGPCDELGQLLTRDATQFPALSISVRTVDLPSAAIPKTWLSPRLELAAADIKWRSHLGER